MEIEVLVNILKQYGPGAGLSILFAYVFFKTLEYITSQYKLQINETTQSFLQASEQQREVHRNTLETLVSGHKEVTTQTLEMMKLSQKYSEGMLNQISEHNLTVHRALDTRITGVENTVGKVQTSIEDLSKKIDIMGGK